MKRRAILVANQHFEHLESLQCPIQDAHALAEVLRDRSRGAFEDVELEEDRESQHVRRALFGVLRRANRDDLVLIYYAGHGKLDRQGLLYLATRETDEDLLLVDSVPVAALRDWIGNSRCRRIVVVLDCCYSGAAGAQFRGGDPERALGSLAAEGRHEQAGEGIFVLSACRRSELAEERAESGHGVFTEAILEGIRTGEADFDHDDQISVEDLYRYVEERVTRIPGAQQPMCWGLERQGQSPVVAHVALPGQYDPAVDPLLRGAVAHDTRWHVFDQISPAYLLDKTFHFVDWNPAFEELVARPLDLVPGDHAQDFIDRLDNAAEVVERSNRIFSVRSYPLVDLETLEYRHAELGAIRFRKLASQACDEHGDLRGWIVQLGIEGGDRIDALWQRLEGVLENEVNWSKYALSYDSLLLRFPPYSALVRQVVSLVGDRRRVVDLGAGTGNGVVALLHALPSREVLAVERNATMLEFLRQKLAAHELERAAVETLKGDVTSCLRKSVADESFDAAIMINVLYALDQPVSALEEAARILRHGGLLALSTPTVETDVDKLFAALEGSLAAEGQLDALRGNLEDARRRHQTMEARIHRDSPEDVARYLHEAGFEILDVRPKQYVESVLVVQAMRR